MRTLRVLTILTKRQMADDGPLLIAALAGAMAFLLVLGLLAFLYPQGFLLHVAAILVILPFLVGMGFFILGTVQVRGDENRGLPALLSVLSAGPCRIILARITTGMVFVVVTTASLMLAITGAIVSGLVQWPEALVPGGLVDLFVALLLLGLACYGLGGLAGQGTARGTAFLWLGPLALAVVSLIIIKGFGRPLAVILVPVTAVVLLYLLMAGSRARHANIALGFIVLMLMVVPAYWLRYACDIVTALVMLAVADETTVTLYGDFRPTTDVYQRGEFTAKGEIDFDDFPIRSGRVHFLLRPIGIMSYLQAKEPGGDAINLGHFGHFWGFYYDEQNGLFINRGTKGTLCAGPEGIGDTPSEDLGRFGSPIAYMARGGERIVFDGQSRCFYAINFTTEDVRGGLDLGDANFQPVDPITAKLGDGVCSVSFSYPDLRGKKDVLYAADDARRYLPVVDESGAIAVLDVKDWKLLMGAGYLPRPRTFFGRGSSKPLDLFDYDTAVIIKQPEGEYAGLIAASVPRQGVPVTVAVFNKDGRLLRESRDRVELGAVSLFTLKYLVESLHPPLLTLASFFTAYRFEAGATYRALFLMPNSFVALQRDREVGFAIQLLWAMLFLLPALALAGFLSWRVVRDAALLGASQGSRRLWGLGVLALGLPAYITYRLVRPRVALALCTRCGRGRRVDRDVCPHCGQAWDVPALEAPAWRVTSALGGSREMAH